MSSRSAAPIDIALLLPSWELHLRAERKSPQTIKSYGDGVRRLLTWCQQADRPAVLDRPTVTGFVAALLDAGAEPATARSRQLAVRRFSAWLAEEGEIPLDPLIGLRPPQLDQKVVNALDDDQIRALISACKGPDLRDRRDEAIVRLMIETGVRAGEVVALEMVDVHLAAGTVLVRRGKGGKGRTVPIGAHAGRALDRYLRVRRNHRLADSSALWLGDRGKEFSYFGLHAALKTRARTAGVTGFHPQLSPRTWCTTGSATCVS